MDINKVQQLVFLQPTDKPLTASGNRMHIELSLLAGQNTLILPSKLSKDALNQVGAIYASLGLTFPTWTNIKEHLAGISLEPVTIEIPQPDESEGYLEQLPLESGDMVQLLVRTNNIFDVLGSSIIT